MAAVAFVRLISVWAIVTGALLLAAARRVSVAHGRCFLRLLDDIRCLGRAGGHCRTEINNRPSVRPHSKVRGSLERHLFMRRNAQEAWR